MKEVIIRIKADITLDKFKSCLYTKDHIKKAQVEVIDDVRPFLWF